MNDKKLYKLQEEGARKTSLSERAKHKAIESRTKKRIGYIGEFTHEQISGAKKAYKENLKQPWEKQHGRYQHNSWENYLPGMAHHPKKKK